MAMKFSTLKRHVRESLKSLGRNGWMTFASVSAVTVTLLLVGVFLVLMLNLNNFAKNIENDVDIRVYIDLSAKPGDITELKNKIDDIPEVKEVTFSSKKQELDNLIEILGEGGSAYSFLQQDNPLNDVYIVKTKDPHDIIKVAKKIETYPYAANVRYGKGHVEKLFSVVEISRNIGIALIIGLLFTAMFLISNTIKITITARRTEIEIMKLVGATNNFIRWPFFLEGLWLGILGSMIPITLIYISYNQLFKYLEPKLTTTFLELLPIYPFVLQVSAILVAIGAFIGIWGSLMSVRKFLKV